VPHLRRTGLSPLSEQTPPPSPASCSSPPSPRCLPARRLALETRSSPALSLERCRLVPAPPASQARSYPPTFVSWIDRGGEPFSFPRRRHRCEAPGRGGGGGGVGLGSTPFAWVPSPARAKRPPRPPTPMVHAWVAAAFGGETSQLGVCSPPAPRCLPARRLALETRSSPALSLERCRLVPAPPASQARSYPPTFVSWIDRGGEPFSFPRRRHRCEAPGRGGGGGGVGLGSTPFAWVPSPARAKRPPRPPTPMVHAWVAAEPLEAKLPSWASALHTRSPAARKTVCPYAKRGLTLTGAGQWCTGHS